MARPRKADYHDESRGGDEGKTSEFVPFNREDIKKKVQSFVGRLKDADKRVEEARGNKSIIMKEAISAGLDRQALIKIIKLESMSKSAIESGAELVQLYAEAIGLQLELPL